ncbi:MAG: hypothetical protein AABX91_03025 [Nanoarchaeota archaeon]
MTVNLIDILLDFSGIRSVKPVWYVRFKTRRKIEGEVFEQTRFKGILEDKYVWEIAPMTLMDPNQIRLSRIHTEMNDIHIPLLEEDEGARQISSIRGIYKRERTYRFGKQISDAVTIDSKIEYKDGRVVKYENK